MIKNGPVKLLRVGKITLDSEGPLKLSVFLLFFCSFWESWWKWQSLHSPQKFGKNLILDFPWCIACPCGHVVETCEHILLLWCPLYMRSGAPRHSTLQVLGFVWFLKENPSAFTFPAQVDDSKEAEVSLKCSHRQKAHPSVTAGTGGPSRAHWCMVALTDQAADVPWESGGYFEHVNLMFANPGAQAAPL